LENIHIHKTGALIRASVRMATLCSGPTTAELADRLDHYAACVGLAFQIRDDILDVEGNTAQLGKTQGKDATQGKATYPALLGLAESRERAESLCQDALQSIGALGAGADPLRWIARYIVGRER
jgi:geranylgeranyl pyrophosphate synthase